MNEIKFHATLILEVLFLLSTTDVEKPSRSRGSHTSLRIFVASSLIFNSEKKNRKKKPENFWN